MGETTHQTSQARIEANRRNAQKSTGPRTPEGKAKSSRNRLVHGLRANKHLILDDDPADFLLLLQDFIDRFQPVGEVEEKLVLRIAACQWRLDSVFTMEAALYRERLQTIAEQDAYRQRVYAEDRQDAADRGKPAPPPPHVPDPADLRARAFSLDCNGPRSITSLTRYETSIERTLDRCIRRLKTLQADRQAAPAGPAPDTPSANPTAPTESNYHSNPTNQGIQETRNLSPTTHNPPPTTSAKRAQARHPLPAVVK